MKKYRIRVGLDVDDTLYECNSYAVSIINSRHPDEEPIKVEDIKTWGGTDRRSEERIKLYSDPEFVRTQPITEGAQEFVRKLSEIADVFFITAVRERTSFPSTLCLTTARTIFLLRAPLIPYFSANPGIRDFRDCCP